MNDQPSPRVLEILEWPLVRNELRARCATDPGRTLVDGIAPLDPVAARARMKKISSFKELLRQDAPPDFSDVTDIEPLLALAEKNGVLKLQDLADIRDFAAASGRIKRYIGERRSEHPALTDEYGRMDGLSGIGGILAKALTDSNELDDAVYPDLKRIRNELRAAREEIEKNISKILHAPSMESVLQEKISTTRNDRAVVLVRSGMKDRVRGTVHDISASGATFYIEPEEITTLNNRALTLEKELLAETARILRALSAKVAEHAERLRADLAVISGLDLLGAAARFSIDTNSSEPEVPETADVLLRQARHPILSLMSPKSVVANDIELDASHPCLIISGANTGGKTVLLKTIGLCALFAMFGLHVPAGPDSRVGIFSDILADIGDDQSLSKSLSTFSGQIVIIGEMLSKADANTLAIIDEIIVGTSPRQGAALAQAILERLAETGSRIVVTTHYPELKELPSADGRFRNASVSFDIDTLRPTYRLAAGLPGVSYAIEISKNYGLPDDVISRARSLLDDREISMEALIEKIQKYEQEITEEKRRLDGISAGLEEEKKQYDHLISMIEKRAAEIKRKEGIDFLDELREYRRVVSGRVADLQRMSMKEAGRAQAELREIERTVRDALAKEKGKLYGGRYVPLDPEDVRPGDRVFVLPLEKEGTVENADLSRKQAEVFLGGSIKSLFSFNDLYRPAGGRAAVQPRRDKKAKKTGERGRGPAGEIPPAIQTMYNTIDLRGKRVEEGLRLMEQEFDRMVRGGIDTAVVIHGHGTGAMKEAVRELLGRSLYVEASRPGESGEGGDGVTVALLRC
ncbi:MAG: Smr/MutS family protein [Spirochaetes bacterium]|nr:Smr/MutS family protein [Spirochaetota bacterium]